jgi:hypothetical protein
VGRVWIVRHQTSHRPIFDASLGVALARASVPQRTLRRWNSGANAATPQNHESGSDDRNPQPEAHSANAMPVTTMARESHVRRATPLVEREHEETVERKYAATTASEAHGSKRTNLTRLSLTLANAKCDRLRRCSGVHPDEVMVRRASAVPATLARVLRQPRRKSPTTTEKIAAGTQAQWIRRRLPRRGCTPLIVPGGMAIGWASVPQ